VPAEKSGTEIAVLYNVYGDRIAEVGSSGAPDVFEEAYHRLDLTIAQRVGKPVRLKLAAANLAYQSVVFKQGGVVLQKFNPGVNVALSLEWNPF
jgi:outer membrane receptor for monomeric catechols